MNQKNLLLLTALMLTATLHGQTRTTPNSPAGKAQPDVTEIKVEAEREAAPTAEAGRFAGTFSTLSAGEINRRGATDMGGIVRYEPLVNAPAAATGTGNIWDGSGYTGYNIRGLEGNRVSLDIDGIPLPDAAPKPDGSTLNSFGIGRDYVDIETFRTVEIGSGTSFAGRGTPNLGGGVGYVTKSPADYLGLTDRPYYVGYKAAYASVNESLAHTFTGAAGLGEFQSLVVYTRRDGEQNDSKGATLANPVDWQSDSVLAKLVWDDARTHNLEFTLDYFKRESDLDAANRASASYVGGARQHALAERFTLSATHLFTPTGTALFDRLSTKIYYQDAVTHDATIAPHYITGGIAYRRDLNTRFHNDSLGLNADAIKQAGDSHRLSYGLAASRTDTSRPWSEVRTRLSDNVVTMQGTKDRMSMMETTRVAAYLNDEIAFRIGDRRATLTPGLRFESVDVKPTDLSRYVLGVPAVANEIKPESDSFVTPSLAFNLGLTEKLAAYASYKRGNRVPTPVEKTGTYDSFSYSGSAAGYAVIGNPDLKKETSDAFEIGLKGQSLNGVTFSLSAFHTAYNDFIEYAVQPYDPVNYPTISFGLYRPENLGKAKIYGLEGSVKLDLGVWHSDLTGFSAILAAGRANSSATNTATGVKSRLPSTGPFKGSLTLGYDSPARRLGASLTTTHIGGRQAPPDIMTGATAARFAVPAATLLDFAAYLRVNDHASLNLGVYNLTDRKYWDYYSARGLAAPTTAATIAEIERYAQPGVNFTVSLTLGF